MSSRDRLILERLDDADACMEAFHELASDPKCVRLKHLRQRACVEWSSSWPNGNYFEWLERQTELCQQLEDQAGCLERTVPKLRGDFPVLCRILEKALVAIRELKNAIADVQVAHPSRDLCFEWFQKKRDDYRRLRASGGEWVACRESGRWFRDADVFLQHLRTPFVTFPCGLQLAADDRLQDGEYERHLSVTHDGDPELREGGFWIDTDSHVARVAHAAQTCRAVYGEWIQESLTNRRQIWLQDSSQRALEGEVDELTSIANWLERFHFVASDTGGARERLIEGRPYSSHEHRICGENNYKWDQAVFDTQFVLHEVHCASDRVFAVAIELIADSKVVAAIDQARACLLEIHDATGRTASDADAFAEWKKLFDEFEHRRLRFESVPVAGEDDPSLLECPWCERPLSDLLHLSGHFERRHSAPAPGRRTWITPAEHQKRVDRAAADYRSLHDLASGWVSRRLSKLSRRSAALPTSLSQRERNKRAKQSRDEKWEREFDRLRSEYPRSKVHTKLWIAEQIAKMPIANEKPAATILRVVNARKSGRSG